MLIKSKIFHLTAEFELERKKLIEGVLGVHKPPNNFLIGQFVSSNLMNIR
jgi:hypothetical protein